MTTPEGRARADTSSPAADRPRVDRPQDHDGRLDAEPRRWTVHDAQTGGTLQIAGWDWGGDGPLALLSHANGFCAALWSLVAKRLRGQYRVIAVDARGHGDSDKPDPPGGYVWDYFVADLIGVADQLLAELGEDRVDFGIGSSFGGIVTAAAAASRPDLFRRIALLDPPAHPDEALRARLGLPSATQPAHIGGQARKRSAVWPSRQFAREKWQNKPMFRAWQPEAFEVYLAEGFGDRDDGTVELKCPPAVEATIFDTTGSLDTFEVATRVGVPVLLVRANQGFLPTKVFAHLAECFQNCTLIDVPAGHLMPLEDPALVAELLNGFRPT